MKALRLDWRFCKYPPGIKTKEEFIGYINTQIHTFLRLEMFDRENCAFPYFIEEDVKTIFVNMSQIHDIEEMDIKVLPKAEYDKRLAECIENVCRYCTHYEENMTVDNMKGHRNSINLDGECQHKQDVI